MLNKIKRIYDALYVKSSVRFIAGTALGVIIWKFSSSAVQDIIVYGSFLYALFHATRGKAAWKQPAGLAFILVVTYHFLTIPFSTSPEMSIHDTAAMLEILAGAFAVPVIFNNGRKIGQAFLCSAVAIAFILLYDLVRMGCYLGADIFAKAHAFKPFILNHSNVASMMAGLAFYVFIFFLWQWRSSLLRVMACLGGCGLCLAYLFVAASRGPQIAFALSFACSGLILPGWKRKALWIAGVIVIGAMLAINYQHVNPRLAEKATMTGFSERDKVWTHTWELVKQEKWFGHGYGKSNFEMLYYASHPPRANYHFPHCHQYWLKLLFEYGWSGFVLYLAAWSILAVSLIRKIAAGKTLDDRLLPGITLLMLLFIHLYGMGDYPDNIVRIAQIWLIPASLVVLKNNETTGPNSTWS